MNCKTINEQIKMIDYLAQKNINPIKIKNYDYWYFSPFRNENTASFKVDISTNRFYDFGEGIGGNLIDLISKLENISIKQVIRKVTNDFSFPKLNVNKSNHFVAISNVKIIECKQVYSYVLKSYLKERGIISRNAYQYLEEITFEIKNCKPQFALGFKNLDGNFELRNSIFKGSSGKNLSIILSNCEDKRVFIFEGFFDFLSFLEINYYPNFNYIVLNSTANLSKLFDYLINENFEEIHLYLDNDLSGNKCTNEIISRYNSSVIDHRIEYRNFNDLNEFLINSIK